MAKIIINETMELDGQITVSQELNLSENILVVTGFLATPHYIEEIDSIDAENFKLEDVEVLKESFGTDDQQVVYEFYVGKFTIKKERYQSGEIKKPE